jgi:ATP-binding cassette subfamily B protein
MIRAHIALVPQDPVIFGASAADNIRYADPDAGIAEVEAAARAAEAHEFIAALPRATTPTSASAACACPAASSSASRSRARC